MKRFGDQNNYTDDLHDQINMFSGAQTITPMEIKNTFTMVKGHGEAYVNYTLAE